MPETKVAQGGASDYSKILVIGPSWLGDMVMAQSLFIVLRKLYKNAHIAVVAPNWCQQVLDRMPQVDQVIQMPIGHRRLGLLVRWRLAKKIKSQQFDLAIVIPGSYKSALLPFFAAIPERRGYVGEYRYGILTDARPLDRNVLPLNVQHYAALAYQANYDWPKLATDPPHPKLVSYDVQQSGVLAKFSLHRLLPILALCPGAEYGPAKRWPVKHFAEVAKQMQIRGWQVWLFGSAKDVEICQQIAAQAGGDELYILAGKTSIGEAVDLMALADYVVTNDSGLMHVAAALERPLIALYGSSSDKFTPPLSKHSHRLSLHLSCSPCFKRDCPLGHTNCLQHILPNEVINLLSDSH